MFETLSGVGRGVRAPKFRVAAVFGLCAAHSGPGRANVSAPRGCSGSRGAWSSGGEVKPVIKEF